MLGDSSSTLLEFFKRHEWHFVPSVWKIKHLTLLNLKFRWINLGLYSCEIRSYPCSNYSGDIIMYTLVCFGPSFLCMINLWLFHHPNKYHLRLNIYHTSIQITQILGRQPQCPWMLQTNSTYTFWFVQRLVHFIKSGVRDFYTPIMKCVLGEVDRCKVTL